MKTPNLSTRTQAAVEAYEMTTDKYKALGAFLHSVVNEVFPVEYEEVYKDGRMLQYEKEDPTREKLMAMVTELFNY